MRSQYPLKLLIVFSLCCQAAYGGILSATGKTIAKEIAIQLYANYAVCTWMNSMANGEVSHCISPPMIEGWPTGSDAIPVVGELMDLYTTYIAVQTSLDVRLVNAANLAAEQRITELMAARTIVVDQVNLRNKNEEEMRETRAVWLMKAFADVKKAKEELDKVKNFSVELHSPDEFVMKQMLRNYWAKKLREAIAAQELTRLPGGATPQWTEEMFRLSERWEAVNALDFDDYAKMKQELIQIAEEKLQAAIKMGQFLAHQIGMSNVDFTKIEIESGVSPEEDALLTKQAQLGIAYLFFEAQKINAQTRFEEVKKLSLNPILPSPPVPAPPTRVKVPLSSQQPIPPMPAMQPPAAVPVNAQAMPMAVPNSMPNF